MNQIKKKISTVQLPQKPQLTLSKELLSQITYFHNQVGEDEWSGVLLYKVQKGGIEDLDNLSMFANRMLMMDVGTSSSTGYEFNEEIIDFYDEYPDLEDNRIGMIHTHHDLPGGAYFSSVDNDELKDNCRNHNYYLSLIVDFSGRYVAKLAIFSDSNSTKATVSGSEGKPVELTLMSNNEVMYVANVDIFFEIDNFDAKQCTEKMKERTLYNNQMRHYTGGFSDYVKSSDKSITTDKKKNDDNLYLSFLCGFLEQDTNISHTNLEESLKKVNEEFKGVDTIAYSISLDDSIEEYVEHYIGNATEYKISITAERAIDLLAPYMTDYPILIREIVDVFSFYTFTSESEDDSEEKLDVGI